jgi:NAD(P)H-nitrite reductase large subunit
MLQSRKVVILRNFTVCNEKNYGTIRIRDDHTNSMDDVSHELNNTIDNKIEWLSEDKIAIFCNHKVYEIDKADKYVWTDENVTWTINKEDGSILVIKIIDTKF